MTRWEEMVGRRRSVVLGAIMLVVLLASVAVAAWLVELRGGAVRLLKDIRTRKLPAFWGRDAVTECYLLSNARGKPIGWSITQRTAAEGGYAGRRVGRSGSELHRLRWQMDAAAQRCSYSVGRDAPRAVSSTAITSGGGKVAVQRKGLGAAPPASAEAPDNYVPQGLAPLVCYLTAARQQEVTFAMILDDEAFEEDGRVRFTRVRVVPEGPLAVRVRFQRRSGEREEIVRFDRTGRIVRREWPASGSYSERASFQAVRKAFPEVDLFVKPDSPSSHPPTGESDGS